jgi:phage baseplate assembly protein gpV
MSTEDQGYAGLLEPSDRNNRYNAMIFAVTQLINQRNHATLVQVQSVTNAGDLSPVGFVDVQPLVNQLDGNNNAIQHNIVHNLPYHRLQGGSDAVILDPKVGDIGLAIFADKDISSVKANKGRANPGSKRRSSMADGLYVGGFLNGTPTQYVRFSAAGIDVVSPTKITLQAPQVEIDASTSLTVNSPQSNFSGTVIIQGLLSWLAGMTGSGGGATSATISGVVRFIGSVFANGKRIDDTHTHNGVQSGSGNSGTVN